MLSINVNYGGKIPNLNGVVKSINIKTNKYKSNGTLPTFTKTITPSSAGGLYVKTFNNYY
jgi:hypothetical protein